MRLKSPQEGKKWKEGRKGLSIIPKKGRMKKEKANQST